MLKYLLIAYSFFYLLSSCSGQHLKILYQNDSGDNEIILNVTHPFDPVELDEQKIKWQTSSVSTYTIYYETINAFGRKKEVVKVVNGKVISDRGISIDKLFSDLTFFYPSPNPFPKETGKGNSRLSFSKK